MTVYQTVLLIALGYLTVIALGSGIAALIDHHKRLRRHQQ